MKKIMIIMLTLFPLLLMALTLEEAIDNALANNHALRQERAEIEVYDQKYYAARGMLLPQLSLVGQYSLSRTVLPESAIPQLPSVKDDLAAEPANMTVSEAVIWENQQTIADYLDGSMQSLVPDSVMKEGSLAGGLQLNQVLFAGGKLLSGIKIADRVRNMQKDKCSLKIQDVIYETTRLYYGVKLAGDVVDIQREALKVAGEHLDDVTEMFAQGLVSEYDNLRAELEYRRLEPEVLQAEYDLALAEENFCNYIGYGLPEDLELETEFILPELEDSQLDDALQEGIEQRIEVQLSELNIRIQEVLVKMEKADFYPRVGLSASYNFYTAADEYDIQGDDFGTMASIGLGFELPLFTGLTRISEVREAQAKVSKAKEADADLQELIRLDIRNAWQKLEHSRKTLQVQENNVALAGRGYEIAQARYASSQGTELEIADAILMQQQARLSYSKAVYDVILAQIYYEKSLGRELDKKGELR
ncbi:MAG: TolC family protein [Candidatus Cloacimonetes bacterium]|nr:TolC family protein [Candidatus Cloacimonadota bacterium]